MFDHTSVLARVQRELLGTEVVFPTSMRLAMAVRQALDRDDVKTEHIVRLLSVEPFMATKIVRMANSVAYNPAGQTVYSVEQAINRVGFNAVRALALASCIAQLKSTPGMAAFQRLANGCWEDSVQRAALARMLAKAQRGVPPDEAMLGGLVSEMGSFYLLFLASNHEKYSKNLVSVLDLLDKHGARVGAQFLESMDMPVAIVGAIRPVELASDHPAFALRNILNEARRLQNLPNPVPAEEPRAEWLQTVQRELDELRAVLKG